MKTGGVVVAIDLPTKHYPVSNGGVFLLLPQLGEPEVLKNPSVEGGAFQPERRWCVQEGEFLSH